MQVRLDSQTTVVDYPSLRKNTRQNEPLLILLNSYGGLCREVRLMECTKETDEL